MASPEQITVLPETLPGDFVEWDEALPLAQPLQSSRGEAGPEVEAISKAARQAAEAHRAATPSGNLPPGTTLTVSALENTGGTAVPHPAQSLTPVLRSSRDTVVQLQAAVAAIDEIQFSAPRQNGAPAAAAVAESHEILLPFLGANAVETTRPGKKKWLIIAGACAAVVILAVAMIPVLNRGRAPSTKPVAAAAPTTAVIQQPEVTAPTMAVSQQPEVAVPERDHSTLPVPASTPTATRPRHGAESVQEAARQPAHRDAEPSREQAQKMDDQLHTPTRLHMKATLAEPSSVPRGGFAAADMSGSDNGNAIGAVFGSPKRPRVQIADQQLVSLPSGVASDLVIQKTLPVYPAIAKAGQVSGTVVLAATISKTGNVDDLRVVSGPFMLRISALNAVRAWRFKPYILYNQPTAFETTIYVHFCGQQDPCARGRE